MSYDCDFDNDPETQQLRARINQLMEMGNASLPEPYINSKPSTSYGGYGGGVEDDE